AQRTERSSASADGPAAGQSAGPPPMHISTRLLKHLAVVLGFAVLALVWTYPLFLQLSTRLAGHPGDNLDLLWNTWWMRQAIESSHLDFFTTDRLFAPFGIDLTLHTHTALPAW